MFQMQSQDSDNKKDERTGLAMLNNLINLEKIFAHEFYQQVHKRKTVIKFILLAFVFFAYFMFVLIIVLYDFLLKGLGISF